MSSRSLSIFRVFVFLTLMGLFVSSCAKKTTAVRAEHQSQPAPVSGHSATVPDRLLGVWAMGETPCTLPINTDADGVLVISEKKIQGYEYYVVPKKIVVASENPLRITLEGTEVYLGSQTVDVTQTITVEGEKLELTDGTTTEIYVECKTRLVDVPSPVSEYVGRRDDRNGLVEIHDVEGGSVVARMRHLSGIRVDA